MTGPFVATLVRGPLVTVALLALIGCGDDRTSAEPSTSPSTTTTAPVSESLHPPGTELADGLLVPEGTTLAGPVFRGALSGIEAGSVLEGWMALLTIDGDDPFVAFDAMAAEVRRVGLPMPGSASSCVWLMGLDQSTQSYPQPRPVADGDPDGKVLQLLCRATAYAGEDADGQAPATISLTLTWGGEATGTLFLDVSPTPEPGRARGSYGEVSFFDPPQGGAPPGIPAASPDPVPEADRASLPERAAPAAPSAGDRFGGTGNCFAVGYSRFRLPEGGQLVATEGGSDGHSVLAVADVDAAVDGLLASAAAPEDTNVSVAPERTVTLPDGREVTRVDVALTAGGGACQLLGTPDGEHLLISLHSD